MGSQLWAFITAASLCYLALAGLWLTNIVEVSDVRHSGPDTESCCHTRVSPCFLVFQCQDAVTVFSLWYLEEVNAKLFG